MKAMARTDKSVLNSWWWSADRLTLIALVVLAVIGIMLVTAASPSVAERIGLPPFYFVTRQLVFFALSVAMMFSFSLMGRKAVWRTAFVILVASMVLLAITVLFGASIKGATRWISFMGFSLQPSEFVKPAFAVTSAWLMARHGNKEKFPGHQMAFGLYLVILCLLLLQPDFGMSVLISCIWGAQLFLSGVPMILIFLLLGLGVLGFFGAYTFFPHVAVRVKGFLNPATSENYQVQKSLDAFGNGGFFGTGPGQGQVKMTLPDAHADFIFAVAGEEFGMLFALALVFLFCFIIIRSIIRIYRSEDLFIILGASGLLVQFGLQSLIHMGSSLQLLPAKGMTLPFISYGGSSLLAMGVGMGMLLALTRKQKSVRA
ncbi:MAG: FtsW/RodA/SpoVE family cell cycle protein [Alphaproteobacteria bacterium]|nr:FtsW/RodA/SpoVE family cell cycle protein [Alphaproteobacteria bacterium]